MDSNGALQVAEEIISPEIVVVAAVGEIDLHTMPLLREKLLGVIDRPLEAEVILDLSGTVFVDSSGLTAIVEADRRLGARSRRLHLVGARGPVARILAITCLDTVLICHPDRATAQAVLTARAPE